MTRFLLALSLLLATAISSSAAGPATRIEVLLNPLNAGQAHLGALATSLELSPGRLAVIADDRRLYAVGWGGVSAIGEVGGLSAFAYTSDGLFLGIRGKDLVYLDASGAAKKIFGLPSPGMGIAAGHGKRMFLFERAGKGRNGLFELLPGKRSRKLLDCPEPVQAVLETRDGRILFAAGGAVFETAPGKRMRIAAAAPGGKPILSLAEDPRTGTVYLADGTSVMALDHGKPRLISKQVGGTLRWQGDGLMVFDPSGPLLVRIVSQRRKP